MKRLPGRPPIAKTARVRQLMKELHLTYRQAYLRWRHEEAQAGVRPMHNGYDDAVLAVLSKYPGITRSDARTIAQASAIVRRWEAGTYGSPADQSAGEFLDPVTAAKRRLRAARLAGDVAAIEAIAVEIEHLKDVAPSGVASTETAEP